MKIAVFDLETARSPEQCGGWIDFKGLGISWGVAWISWELGGSYEHFRGERIEQLADLLAEADLVVTFNGFRFDLPLLRAHLDDHHFGDFGGHVDLLDLVYTALGHRVSLDELSAYTLGAQKSGHGQHAPILAAEGWWDELASYCQRDVTLTLLLYRFAHSHGYLLYSDGRIPLSVPGGATAWKPPPPKRDTSHTPATDAQICYLRSLYGYPWQPTPGLTKRQASQMIETKLATRKLTSEPK